jgi:hypothetical protein
MTAMSLYRPQQPGCFPHPVCRRSAQHLLIDCRPGVDDDGERSESGAEDGSNNNGSTKRPTHNDID